MTWGEGGGFAHIQIQILSYEILICSHDVPRNCSSLRDVLEVNIFSYCVLVNMFVCF